jgi:hypothetical protein
MGNPQQPELARSRKTPAQDQDSVATVVDGQQSLDATAPRGPVPQENQPGHHPPEEQDKPDLDAFAQRFGIVEGEGATASDARGERGWRSFVSVKRGKLAVGAAVLSAVAAVLGLVMRRRRRLRP